MSEINSHHDLIVWQKAMDLTVMIYDLSRHFPKTETFQLTSQLIRSVISVPANIAEGHGRATKRDFAQFLSIAKGSLMETETFLTLAVRLKCLQHEMAKPAFDLITEISKMLTVLRKRLLEPDLKPVA